MSISQDNTRKEDLIRTCKTVFLTQEARHGLGISAVVMGEFGRIAKCWWVYQLLLLGLAWYVVSTETDVLALRRMLAVIATLFGLLILPECVKNDRTNSIEIEMAALYSLRQMVAIRLIIFSMVDTVLLAGFSVLSVVGSGMGLVDVILQFIFPVLVTATICLGALAYGGHSERHAVLWCLLWTALWALLIANDVIYAWLTTPLMALVMGVVLAVGVMAVRGALSRFTHIERGGWYAIGA